MKLILVIALNAAGTFANVLDRIRLEDAMQQRVERALNEIDASAKVQLSLTFRKQGPLPGTSLAESEELTPNTVSESDIEMVAISITSKLANMTPDMETAVFRMIPVKKNRVKLTFNQTISSAPISGHVTSQDLAEISRSVTDRLQKFLLAAGAVFLSLAGAGGFFLQVRAQKAARENIRTLAQAIAESAGGGSNWTPQALHPESASLSDSAGDDGQISLPASALKELFADVYWCEADGYAHWLWNKLSTDQKSALMSELPFMRGYTVHFVSLQPVERGEHGHPYYLEPQSLWGVSQADLAAEIRKQPSYWQLLSPLRQKTLPLPMSEKLKVVTEKASVRSAINVKSVSAERKFDAKFSLGDLNFEDEEFLLKHHSDVPEQLRRNIKSLAWLSLREPAYIQKVLSQHDARSLAGAWVGCKEVLGILEQNLPEKKLKLLHSYAQRSMPSRSSPVFQALVDDGLKNEAA